MLGIFVIDRAAVLTVSEEVFFSFFLSHCIQMSLVFSSSCYSGSAQVCLASCLVIEILVSVCTETNTLSIQFYDASDFKHITCATASH
jgi:hypothetical protein